MVVVVVIVLVAVVVLVAGGLALRAAHRGDRTAEVVPGEPTSSAPTVTEPSVDEAIAELETQLAPPPEARPPEAPEVEPVPTAEELEQLLEAPAVAEPAREKPRLRDRLGRTRAALSGAFGGLRGRKVDDDTWDELEEALLLADVGLPTTERLLDAVRAAPRTTTSPTRRD